MQITKSNFLISVIIYCFLISCGKPKGDYYSIKGKVYTVDGISPAKNAEISFLFSGSNFMDSNLGSTIADINGEYIHTYRAYRNDLKPSRSGTYTIKILAKDENVFGEEIKVECVPYQENLEIDFCIKPMDIYKIRVHNQQSYLNDTIYFFLDFFGSESEFANPVSNFVLGYDSIFVFHKSFRSRIIYSEICNVWGKGYNIYKIGNNQNSKWFPEAIPSWNRSSEHGIQELPNYFGESDVVRFPDTNYFEIYLPKNQ